MLLIEYVGHIGHRSLTDGHLERHLEYFKRLNDARVASVGFIKYNASTTRINKEKTLKSSSRSFLFSTGLYAVGTQKNRLDETVLFEHPKHMLKLMGKKIFTMGR